MDFCDKLNGFANFYNTADRGSAVLAWTPDSTCLEFGSKGNQVLIIHLLLATMGMLVFHPPYFFFPGGPRLGELGFGMLNGIV